jgi:flagellin-specific chaperone FliS
MEQDIMAAGRVDLVIRTFDLALSGCNQGDATKTLKALTVLERSLNAPAFPELANSLLGIYRYCQDLVLKGAFREAHSYLNALHDAWVEVKRRKEARRLRPGSSTGQ